MDFISENASDRFRDEGEKMSSLENSSGITCLLCELWDLSLIPMVTFFLKTSDTTAHSCNPIAVVMEAGRSQRLADQSAQLSERSGLVRVMSH